MAKTEKKKSGPVVDLDSLEGDTFIGEITDVKFGKSNPNQPDKEYVTLVMNVDYMENPYELYIPYSERKQSVWAHFLEALKACDVTMKDVNDLKGESFRFERKDIILRGGFKAKEGFPLPIEHLGEE